jgi:hypothetical protein
VADIRHFAGRAYCGETNQASGDEIAFHADIGSIPFTADSSQVIRPKRDAFEIAYQRRTSLADEQMGSRGRNNQVQSPCNQLHVSQNISDAGAMLDVTKPAEVSEQFT